MTKKTQYIVILMNDDVAKFSDPDDAHGFAWFYSNRYNLFIEVHAPDGIIGQYDNGSPTPEFRCREDAWFPPGPRMSPST